MKDSSTYILMSFPKRSVQPGIWEHDFCWTEQEEYKLQVLR